MTLRACLYTALHARLSDAHRLTAAPKRSRTECCQAVEGEGVRGPSQQRDDGESQTAVPVVLRCRCRRSLPRQSHAELGRHPRTHSQNWGACLPFNRLYPWTTCLTGPDGRRTASLPLLCSCTMSTMPLPGTSICNEPEWSGIGGWPACPPPAAVATQHACFDAGLTSRLRTPDCLDVRYACGASGPSTPLVRSDAVQLGTVRLCTLGGAHLTGL